MQLSEGKAKFIESWGTIGTNWGVSRTMAQVHALLMLSPRPMCMDDIVEQLQISRGNACMTLHSLIDWELVHKVLKPGDRKDYYEAEKDVLTMLKQIIKHRKRKELDPLIKVLDELKDFNGECEDSQEFCKMVDELSRISKRADSTLDNILNSDTNWIFQVMMRAV